MPMLMFLLVFTFTSEIFADVNDIVLSPDRSFFTKYDLKISCTSKQNHESINKDLELSILDSLNVPYNVSRNTLIPLKRVKNIVATTIACLYNGVEVFRRTIVFIPKPQFKIKIIPEASLFAVDALDDIECTVEPWADGFKIDMMVLGEEPVHRKDGRFAKLTIPKAGVYYFLCSAKGLGYHLRKSFHIKVIENILVPGDIIFNPLIYYLPYANSTTNLTFAFTQYNTGQINLKFISGDDIVSIKDQQIRLNTYARPGQFGMYNILRNRIYVFNHTFSYITNAYQSISPPISKIIDFKTNKWKCGFGNLSIPISDIKITLIPKHNPFLINGNVITRIHGFGGDFVCECFLENGDFSKKHVYKINVRATAALHIEPKTVKAFKENIPKFRCSVNPPDKMFEIKWKILGSSSSHVVNFTDTSLLIPTTTSPFEKSSYTCLADALTVHLSTTIYFEVREPPTKIYNKDDIIIEPQIAIAFIDDPLYSYLCKFKHTNKYTEGFNWKYISGDQIMKSSENYLYVLPNMTVGQHGKYGCYYNGDFIRDFQTTLIGKAEMEMKPPSGIINDINNNEFKCYLKGNDKFTQFINWTLPSNDTPFSSEGNILYVTQLRKGEWRLTCNFKNGDRQIKQKFLLKIQIEAFMYIEPPVSYRPWAYFEKITCNLKPFEGKITPYWTNLGDCVPMLIFSFSNTLHFNPFFSNTCHAKYKCIASLNKLYYEIIHDVKPMPPTPTWLTHLGVKLDVEETFVFTWEKRPICCVFPEPNDVYNYALWWINTKRKNPNYQLDFQIKGNCLFPISPRNGDWGSWKCIFNGKDLVERKYIFLGSNATEIVSNSPVDRVTNFKRYCSFKNVSTRLPYVTARVVWSTRSFITEGDDFIYFNYTEPQKVMIYCTYKYRGQTFQSRISDIFLQTAWLPSLEVSQDDWTSRRDTHKIFYRNNLKNINCKVISPHHSASDYFLSAWTVHSPYPFYKTNSINPQVLVPINGIITSSLLCTCSAKLLGKLFSINLKITALDALLHINTGTDTVIEDTPLVAICLPLPDMVHVKLVTFTLRQNGTKVESKKSFENPRKFILRKGSYTLTCSLPNSKGIAIPRTLFFKEAPDLVLSNPNMVDFIVDGTQFAECVMKWKTPGGATVGRVSWCDIKTSDNAYFQKNKLFFHLPREGFARKEVKCCFEYMLTKTSRMFKFNVYDPSFIQIGSFPKQSKTFLFLEDSCEEICQTNWIQINRNAGFEAQIINPTLIGRNKSSLKIVLEKNKYFCINVDQPVCFETTCKATLNAYNFQFVTRRRCYIQKLNIEGSIIPTDATIPAGGSFAYILKDMNVIVTMYAWQVINKNEEIMPLPTGILRTAIPPLFAGETVTLMCSPKYANKLVSWANRSISVLSTLDLNLAHENDKCIKPGEILTCVAPLSTKLPEIVLIHFDKQHFYKEQGHNWVKVPTQICMNYYRIGCRVQEDAYIKTIWFSLPTCVKKPQLILSRESVRMGTFINCRALDYEVYKYRLQIEGVDENNIFSNYCPFTNAQGYSIFDAVCPTGNIMVRCSAYLEYNHSEMLITSTILMINVIAYEPFFQDKALTYGKMNIFVLIMIFATWFSVLLFNICILLYLHNQLNINRCILLELMHEWNLGGTRQNISRETGPFLYITRKQLDPDIFRHLKNCIQDYSRCMDIGQSIFFLWLSGSDEVRIELLKSIRKLIIMDSGSFIGTKYWKVMEKDHIDLYKSSRSFKFLSRRGIHNPSISNFGAYLSRA